MSYASWSGESKKKSDIRTWSLYPFISTIDAAGKGIDNLSTLQVSSINGFSFPQEDTLPVDWSLYPMISSFSGKGFSISDVSTLQVSSINGFSFPQDDTLPVDWSLYPMISSFSGKGFSIRDLSTLQVSSINGFSFPQEDTLPIDWSLYPMISSFSGNNFSITSLANLQVSSINNVSFPQVIPPPPADNTSNWSLFPMRSSFAGNNFSITTLANLQVSTINNVSFPQVIPPPPADNTSNWATFFARADIQMSNRSIVNLNQINNQPYPPNIPVQNPDRWSEYVATESIKGNNQNLQNVFNGQFNNQVSVGGIFQTLINNGDVSCDNITVGNLATQQADVNIYGVNLAPGDSSLFVQGGTTLDGGGTIHGITIGTLPVSGVNTQRVDVLPTGITITSPTFFTVLGAGAISLNVGGAGNFAVGGALSLAGGAFIEMNSSNVRLINTSAGNENTLLNLSRLDGPFNANNQHPLIVGNSGSAGTELVNVTLINGLPYPPSSVSSFPSQTLLDVKATGTDGGNHFNFINVFGTRELNTGLPVLIQTNTTIFESTTIIGLVLDTSNSRISLPPGNYLIDVFCPVLSVGNHKCRLENIDTNTTIAVGNNGFTDTNNFSGASSTLSASFSIAVQTSVMIQQQIGVPGLNPPASMGFPSNFSGTDEIYTTVRFTRIGDAI